MGTSAAVKALLLAVGHTGSLDAEIIEYLCSVIEDPDEGSFELLLSVLGEYVSSFSSLSSDRQAELVLQLLEDAKLEEPRHTSCSSADDDDGLQAVVAALRQAKLQCPEDADACCDITNTRAASGSEASSSASSMKEGPDVGPLLALCPASISSCFLQHCLQHNFHSNLEAAANWLLEADHAQLLREQQAWERDMQQRQREQEDVELQNKMQKRLIVQKFDLRAVSDASAGCKKGAKQQGPDLLPAPKKGQQESKLRYRDGRVVSTKGEKVIVEKVGEDWDGGSRGKVFTKGKRGKGFH